MQLADTLAITPVKSQGSAVPRRISVVENHEDWRVQSSGNWLWSSGSLQEVISWTDLSTCQEPVWERLVMIAPELSFEAARKSSYKLAWRGLAHTLEGISIKVEVNTPRVNGYAAVDVFPSAAADTLMVVHLYTKEYFEYYQQAARRHPTVLSAWLDIFRHVVLGSYSSDWSDDPSLSLSDHFKAGHLKVHQGMDAQAAEEVYLLNRQPGELITKATAFRLPRQS